VCSSSKGPVDHVPCTFPHPCVVICSLVTFIRLPSETSPFARAHLTLSTFFGIISLYPARLSERLVPIEQMIKRWLRKKWNMFLGSKSLYSLQHRIFFTIPILSRTRDYGTTSSENGVSSPRPSFVLNFFLSIPARQPHTHLPPGTCHPTALCVTPHHGPSWA